MADIRLVQKEEIAILLRRCMRVARTAEREIALLPDCAARA